ncbi:unnamed protein product [Gongylonema pulchrum]|uniref:Uncharacterized protein n=1 Tax=Gongylonema pulchrum TaxID=637853 RepID=A0A3P7M735_9BILA|nr:unnamed protein product [Gongylonema pulchrum]
MASSSGEAGHGTNNQIGDDRLNCATSSVEECGTNSSNSEQPDGQAVVADQLSPRKLVETIVAKLRANGKTCILPVNDEAAMEAIVEPFKLLIDIGILPEFLVDACISVPQLFISLALKGETSIQIIELIVNFCEFTYEDSIRFFATYNDELMFVGPEEMQKCLEVLETYGFKNKAIGNVIRSCPALIFAEKSEQLAQNAENLFSHFTKNQAEDKIEYIYCHMLMEGEDFAGCTKLASLSLNELMDRHELLLKTGIYKTPDPRRPQLKSVSSFNADNPKLKKIVDSNAEEFATRVAQITVEEWRLFQELQEKKRDVESPGEERPFERVKPSMRKQLERRKKLSSLRDHEKFESYDERY